MPEVSLGKLIKLKAPREWSVWRAMSDICAGRKPISARQEMRIDGAAGPLFEKCRREVLKKHKIDPKTLVSAAAPDAGSFSFILSRCETRKERETQITSLASSAALIGFQNRLMARYRRRIHQLETRINAKILAALNQPGVVVTGTLDGVTPRRPHTVADIFAALNQPEVVVTASPHEVRRPLGRAELEKARIDLHGENLVVGNKIWGHVDVIIPDRQIASATAGVGPRGGDRKAPLVDRVASWLRGEGSQWRDGPSKLIAEKFGEDLSRETIRQARNKLGSSPRTKRSSAAVAAKARGSRAMAIRQ